MISAARSDDGRGLVGTRRCGSRHSTALGDRDQGTYEDAGRLETPSVDDDHFHRADVDPGRAAESGRGKRPFLSFCVDLLSSSREGGDLVAASWSGAKAAVWGGLCRAPKPAPLGLEKLRGMSYPATFELDESSRPFLLVVPFPVEERAAPNDMCKSGSVSDAAAGAVFGAWFDPCTACCEALPSSR